MKNSITISTLVTLLFLIGTTNLNAQTVGTAAPDFTLNNTNGGAFTLSEQTGKVVMIFFFGHACSHCKSNGPNTQAVYNTYKDNPNFVAVGIDTWGGNVSSLESYRAITGIEYPLLLEGQAVVQSYGTTYDRVVVVDGNGIIMFMEDQQATESNTSAASLKIAELLNNLHTTSTLESEIKNPELIISPNVASYELNFNNPLQQKISAEIRIVDISGRNVVNKSIGLASNNTIDISSLNKGVYMLLLQFKGELFSARFVKP